MRPKSHFPDDALAELSGVLRPGPDAERRSARGYWRHERRRFIGDRLAWRAISQAHPAGAYVYSAGYHIRCLFCAAAYADDNAAVRCRDGFALVARTGATHWRSGCRDFRHPLFGDSARCILRCAPGRLVTGSLGWRPDLRSFRLL